MKKLVLAILILGLAFAGYKLYPFFQKTRINADKEETRINAEEQNKLLFSVVLDNAPEARPYSGLTKAELVIETLAEGPATRYLAFFNDKEEVEKIGPVRSARPYFLDWTRGFDVPFVHSGGSTEALMEIAHDPEIKDINEFFNERYFWRDKKKPAPHNLFTSTKLMKELIEKKGWQAVDVSFPRKRESRLDPGSEAGMTENLVSQISLDFSAPNFAVNYKYDPADNSYARFLAGKDQDIQAKNVVVLETTSRIIDQKLLTIDLETLGTGKAVIFRDGEALQARWRKLGKASPLELLDADGTQIELNPGQTWIEVLDQRASINWK